MGAKAIKQVAEQEYLTPQQVATRLAISVSAVYDWCNAGALPSVKIGRLRRIPRDAFEAWLARRREDATPQVVELRRLVGR